jgi:hypothetical protein
LALVIGNGAYTAPGAALSNPANDAQVIGGALKLLGFQVTCLVDQTKAQMIHSIGSFLETLSAPEVNADAGLIFYAGHGVQMAGQNYLVPIDCSIENALAFEQSSILLDTLISRLETTRKAGLIFLDCCRNNPFPTHTRSLLGGLAQIDAPAGTFIAYSTAPGAVAYDGTDASNSPFSSSLAAHMPTSGISVSQLMITVRREVFERTKGNQMPWDSSSLLIDFAFNPTRDIVPTKAMSLDELEKARQSLERQKEEEYWTLTSKSDSPQLLRSFATQYPYSKHRREAERKLTWLRWKNRFFWSSAAAAIVAILLCTYATIQWNRFEKWPHGDLVGGDIALDLVQQQIKLVDGIFDASRSLCRLRCIVSWPTCVAYSYSYNPHTKKGVCYRKEETLFIDTSTDANTSTSYFFPSLKPALSPFKIDWDLLYVGDPIKPNGDPADPTDSHNRERNDRYNAWGYRITELDKLPGAATPRSHKNAGIRCQKTCADEPKCSGFTYNVIYQRCKLFGVVKDKVRIPAYDPTGAINEQMEMNIPTVISGCREQVCPK